VKVTEELNCNHNQGALECITAVTFSLGSWIKMSFCCQYFSGDILEVQAGELKTSMMNAASVALSTVYIDVFLNYIQKDILAQVPMAN